MTDDQRDLAAIRRAMTRLRERHDKAVRQHLNRWKDNDPKRAEADFQRAAVQYDPKSGQSFATWLEKVLAQGAILEYRRRVTASFDQKRRPE